ncbi:MAG: hypothetical protein HOV81_18355 [Kofleriaceae bacterium]|nr:hypothetical protein [Kofleriaceae bacterium]
MPKFLCKCDEVINLSVIPSPNEWRIMSDTKLDTFSDQVDVEEIYLATDSMLRCPKCDRLWVFWDGAEVATEYVRPPSGS